MVRMGTKMYSWCGCLKHVCEIEKKARNGVMKNLKRDQNIIRKKSGWRLFCSIYPFNAMRCLYRWLSLMMRFGYPLVISIDSRASPEGETVRLQPSREAARLPAH